MYAVSNSPAVAVGQGKNSSQGGLLACPWHVVLPAACQRPLPMHVWLVGITGLLREDLCSLPTAPWASSQPLVAGLPYAPFLILKIDLFFSRLLMAAWIAPLPPEKAIWGNFWNPLPFSVSPVFFPFWCSSIPEQVFSPRVSPLTCSVFLYVLSYLAVHHTARCRMQWYGKEQEPEIHLGELMQTPPPVCMYVQGPGSKLTTPIERIM